MKLKKMMMSGLCACLMLGTLAGCGSAQGDDAQSEDPTVILVGVSPDYPPYESLDSDGNIVGFDADMLVELEKYMNEDGGNYDLQFRQMEFNAILSQLPAKQLDMAISGFTYDEERKVAWSDPYTATAQVAVMPKDTEITSVDDLKGKTIAAQTASKRRPMRSKMRTCSRSRMSRSSSAVLLPDSMTRQWSTLPWRRTMWIAATM